MLKLLEKIKIGSLELKNRVIMAPLTRNRSNEDGVPSDLNVAYYSQRASAGLIIAEATSISKQGVGYVNAPGIYSLEQVKGWKKVTDEVHKNGGLIYLQIFHVGRISHSDFLDGKLPVAPSNITPSGQVFTPNGMKDYEMPRALELNEISNVINDFKTAAQNAKDAGFDGVEIHGANGYLINQFIDDISNKRIDGYGNSIENRSKILFEVIQAVLEVWDSKRVGVRLSPSGLFNSVGDSNSKKTYTYIVDKLNNYDLAYLHLINPMMPIDEYPEMVSDVAEFYGKFYHGDRIINCGYTRTSGNEAIAHGLTEMVAYGNLFIANPDLPKRFELNSKLNSPNPDTFYGGGQEGYIDYPFLEKQ